MSQTTKPAKRGRRTVARHGELTSPQPFGQLLKILGIALAVVLVSGAGVAAYAAYDLTSSFTAGAEELEGQSSVPPDIGAIEGGVNLLITATDECQPAYAQYFGDRCKGPDAANELNDVNLLVHISDNPRRVTVVSFPRDLMVRIPSCTRKDGTESPGSSKEQINTAYADGGLSCVAKTIADLSGLNIPFAAKVNFGGVINITDALGGVEVCIGNGGIRDRHTGIDWPAGPRTIKGLEAVQFLRTRYGLENASDLARISNQQQYMSKLAHKLAGEDVLSNPALLYKLATTAVHNVTPSQSLTNPLTLVQIALAVKDVPFEEIVFIQYPVVDDPWNKDRVIPNDDAAADLWSALAANQPIVPTNDPNGGGGVIVVEPTTPNEDAAPTDPVDAGSDTSATPDPSGTPDPIATSIELPGTIPGTTAAQETCSAGNLQG